MWHQRILPNLYLQDEEVKDEQSITTILIASLYLFIWSTAGGRVAERTKYREATQLLGI